jgi:hypothetical protein
MGETMSHSAKKEYLAIQKRRYGAAPREQKSRILDEVQEVSGMHRKSVIRAFARRGKASPGKAGRPPVYGPELTGPLKTIWRYSRQPCSKRLHEVIRLWLPYYTARFGPLDEQIEQKLLNMSPATIDRFLAPVRPKTPKSRSGQSHNILKGQIPIRRTFGQVPGPGYLEVDTVAHCGGSMRGAFVWSISYVDIWSGWTENRGLWNCNQRQVIKQTKSVEAALPFYIQGFDTDNGPEFINNGLFKFLRKRAEPIDFTRTRAYRKNDNAHVEQRQFTHVRQLLGYDRIDCKNLLGAINDLYENTWRLYQNLFLPSMHLEAKWREGSKIHRRHSHPQTPCDLLLECDEIDKDTKDHLRDLRHSLNPFDLYDEIERKLHNIIRRLRRWQQKKETQTPAPASTKNTLKAPSGHAPLPSPQRGEAPAWSKAEQEKPLAQKGTL